MMLMVLLLLTALGLAASPGPYTLGPRDVVHVEVFGEADLSMDYEIASDGTVTMPFVGAVPITGQTTEEAAAVLTTRYLDGVLVNPQISVRVTEHRSQQVEVYGAVDKPGSYYLKRPTTLLEIISQAGWVDNQSDGSDTRHIVLRRANGEVTSMGLTELVSGAASNLLVQSGDTVSVEEGQFVYVGGEVKNAGPVVFSEGLTVSQALLQAGGPAPTAWLRGAYIVRGGEKLTINLRRITDGRAADVSMKAGDQLFIKVSPI